MRKYFIGAVVILTVMLINFTGCVPSKPTEEVEILPSERLINKLEVNRRKIRNFEGSGTINVNSSQFTGSASFNIILQKPDSIYLAVMGPFNIELANALVTKDNFVFYDALQNTVYTGGLSGDVLRSIFKINLTFEDLMDALVGSVNLTPNLYKTPDEFKVQYDEYNLAYHDSLNEVIRRYKVNVRELGITDFSVSTFNDEPLLQSSYSSFEVLENVAIPFKINVNNTADNQRISIEYRNIKVNKKNIYIDFNIPRDATVIKW